MVFPFLHILRKNVEVFMESLWKKTVTIPSYPVFSGEVTADAAVIGGGMAGILTAWMLAEKGVKVVVLEAGVVAGGQTGNTTAKITSQHGVIYRELIEKQGQEAARFYASLNERAVSLYGELAEKLGIDCSYERLPACLYTLKEPEILKKEAEAASSLGIDAVYKEETDLPFAVKGALYFKHQAQFHPLQFLQALAGKLTIYEHTRVLKVQEKEIQTAKGRVRAGKIVFACHYPFINRPGYYFMRMHQERSYVLALEGAARLSGMYLGIDADMGYSFRNAGELLLFGGEGHRTGENRTGGRYDKLRTKAREFYPDAKEVCCWSAQDCMTLDGIPYIGRYSSSEPNWYVATGFGKWGMTSSMVSALLLSEAVAEGREEFGIFSPERFTLTSSASSFCKEGIHAVKDLSRSLFAGPRGEIEELPEGHGGVVAYDNEKVGACKEDGEVHLVTVRCPHMGCQLEWDPDEKNWACPCHGSRFDQDGKLLDGPAQTDLERK